MPHRCTPGQGTRPTAIRGFQAARWTGGCVWDRRGVCFWQSDTRRPIGMAGAGDVGAWAGLRMGRGMGTKGMGRGGATLPGEGRRVRILVSSVVYGYEDFLDGIHALLGTFGYEVLMSHKGTVEIDPDVSAMSSCLAAVERCDVFLGIILPQYGTGKEDGQPHSIVHREAARAIELNKPRWFLVHEHVAVARQLLAPYRDETQKPRFALRPGMEFKPTAVLSDLRVLELYELAMRHDVPSVKDRRGNWVQTYGTDDDARLFATAQFRRYHELERKYLPRLSRPGAVRGAEAGS